MDLVLTGLSIGAEETERAGLVSRVVPTSDVLKGALKVAEVIASKSKPLTMMAKESRERCF